MSPDLSSALPEPDREFLQEAVDQGFLDGEEFAGLMDTFSETRKVSRDLALDRWLVDEGRLNRNQVRQILDKTGGESSEKDCGHTPEPTPDSELDGTLFLSKKEVLGTRLYDRADQLSGGGWRYRHLEGIAKGGMGQIFSGFDPDLQRTVAIKILSKENSNSLSRARFLNECRITSQLEHPNILPVHEVGQMPTGELYLVMKLIRGQTLAELLDEAREKRQRGESHEASGLLQILIRVCDAMAFAHSRGFIHRDLKPANIMIGSFGEVLVMDWGIGKELGSESGRVARGPIEESNYDLVLGDKREAAPELTLEGTIMGTPAYMSPEQARGDHGAVDARSDIYALGALLYELLCLFSPHSGTSASAVLGRIVRGEFIPPSERDPEGGVPRELEAVVLKAMATHRGDRYSRVQDFQEELQAFQAGKLLQSASYHPLEIFRKWLVRHKTIVFSGIFLGLIFGSLIGLFRYREVLKDRAKIQQSLDWVTTELDSVDLVGLVNEEASSSERPGPELRELPGQMKRRIQALDVYMKAVVVLDQALSIDPRQRDLLEKRQEVGRRVGLLALGSKDFQLARHAFSRLRAIGVNEAEVDALLDRVTTVQSALFQWRAQRLEEILSDLREGLSRNGRAPGSPLIEDYCLECAGYRDKQTVEILSGKLGLKSLVDRVVSGAEKIVFSQAERDIAKFVCRVLGRIQLEESLPPLLEWAQIVPDPELAIEVGIALCNTRREEAGGAVRSLRERFGADSNVWQRIGRYYPRIPGLPESKSTSDLDSQIERGKEWLVRKNYVRALEVYEKILSTAPNDRDALAGMGSVYLAQGRMKEAERYFCRALETTGPLRGPKSVLLTNRGYARFQLGRHAEAHEDCDRSLELDRERSRSHVLKGLLCLQTKDFSEARKHLDRGIRLDPEVTMGYIARGNLHSAQKEYEKALADYDRAIDLDPQLSIAYVNRANVYRQTRRYESAMRDIGRALELSPNNLLAYLNRGMLFNARKDGRSALNDFDQALRIQPRSRRARFGRGIAHMILNQPREAVDDFNAAYSLGNRTWDLLLRRGRCYYFIKEYEKSVVDFDRVLRARPNLRGANYLRGLSYLALQKYEKALADSESALVVDPGLAGAYKMRAQCRMKLGKTEGVVEDLRKYLSLSPQAKDRETIERLIRQKSSR